MDVFNATVLSVGDAATRSQVDCGDESAVSFYCLFQTCYSRWAHTDADATHQPVFDRFYVPDYRDRGVYKKAG